MCDEVAIGQGRSIDVWPGREDEPYGVTGIFLLNVASEEIGAGWVNGFDLDRVDSNLTLTCADGEGS